MARPPRSATARGDAQSVVTQRMPSEDRKRQIVQVALKTVAQHGLHGATVARIAKGAGVTQAALYAHFESREEILLAVLDVIYDEILTLQQSSKNESALEHLREVCMNHAKFIGSRKTSSHAHLFIEFIASSPEYGLRDALREKEAIALRELAAIVDRGKHEGTILPDVDSEHVAVMLTGWAWIGDIAQLIGMKSSWHPDVSTQMLDMVLERIAAEPGAAG